MTICRQDENDERNDGGMKKERVNTSFEVLFYNIKALVREHDGAIYKYGGEKQGSGKEGEKMTGMQKRLLFSPVALMCTEDKVRLETGMPEAQWRKKEQAGGWRDENIRKEGGRNGKNTVMQVLSMH